jgi:general secretion pathway protein N
MMDIARRYPLISALGVLGVLLAAVLVLEARSTAALRQRVTGASASKPAAVQTKLLPALAAVNPDVEYAETGSRPLFIPTRRPAPAQATPTSVATMNKGQFTLTGVTIAGQTKIALLREKASGRVVRVEQGKEVNGITVGQIDAEQVTLTQGGDQEVVQLMVSKAGGGPPAVGPAPASAPVAGPFGPIVAPAPAPGANPTQRAVAPPVAAPAPGTPPTPPVNPNTLFGPRPSGISPGPGPIPDPTTATPPTSAVPLTPEELLARRRARRNQQTQ